MEMKHNNHRHLKARSSDQALSNASDEDLAVELTRRMSGNSLYDESFTPWLIDNVSNEEEIGETGSGTVPVGFPEVRTECTCCLLEG